jgi:hypothetical protein
MENNDSQVGQKGRFYLTKHIWVPQEPIEKLNLKMADVILRRMPKLPLDGEDAMRAFPVLAELKKSHAKIKADLEYLLSHHEEIPALHEVHPRDLYVAGRAWRTFLLKIWGHEIEENTAALHDAALQPDPPFEGDQSGPRARCHRRAAACQQHADRAARADQHGEPHHDGARRRAASATLEQRPMGMNRNRFIPIGVSCSRYS